MNKPLSYRYYYMDDQAQTIYYSDTEVTDRPDLIFVTMSKNPNPKAAMSLVVQHDALRSGYKIKPLE